MIRRLIPSLPEDKGVFAKMNEKTPFKVFLAAMMAHSRIPLIAAHIDINPSKGPITDYISLEGEMWAMSECSPDTGDIQARFYESNGFAARQAMGPYIHELLLSQMGLVDINVGTMADDYMEKDWDTVAPIAIMEQYLINAEEPCVYPTEASKIYRVEYDRKEMGLGSITISMTGHLYPRFQKA